MSDMSDKVSGRTKEQMGKMTGNKTQEMHGKAIKARGEAKDKAEDLSNRLRLDRDSQSS